MILEQPAELNKYCAGRIEEAAHGQIYRMLFPVMLFAWALGSEEVLIRPLLGKENAINPWVSLPLLVICCFVIFPTMIKYGNRLERRLKKTLLIDRNGLKRSSHSSTYIRWRQIAGWWLEPVRDSAEFQILRFDYIPRGAKRRRRWSLVLKAPEQTNLLKAELEKIREDGDIVPDLGELSKALPQIHQNRLPNLWPVTFALFFSWQAIFLLLPAFTLLGTRTESNFPWTSSGSDDSPIARFVKHHFANVEQFRSFLLITGTCVALLAIIFWVWSVRFYQVANMEDHVVGQ